MKRNIDITVTNRVGKKYRFKDARQVSISHDRNEFYIGLLSHINVSRSTDVEVIDNCGDTYNFRSIKKIKEHI